MSAHDPEKWEPVFGKIMLNQNDKRQFNSAELDQL